MRIKEGFALRRVGDESVILATGSAAMLLNGIIKLNGVGALLWEQISTNCASEKELADFLCSRYNISFEQAEKDVAEFIDVLKTAKCIEE